MHIRGRFDFATRIAVATIAAATVATSPASAQDDGLALEEIIVTAERRETSLQETPAAIVAITGESIESAGINNLNEMTLMTPGINIQGINRNQQYVAMRGNVTEGGDAGLAQSIGFFIDGLYFGRSSLFNQSLADVERVEILRGPQGTLWGHNIVGGSINVITRDPTQELEADVKLSIGNFDRREISGRIAGGLSDSVTAQLSFAREEADGYVTNLDSGQDLGSEDVYLLRGKLVWDITDNFRAKLTGTYQNDTSGMNARIFLPGPNAIRTPPPPGRTGPVLSEFVIPENFEEETYQRSAIGTNDFETSVGSLDLEYTFDNSVKLSSLTGFVKNEGFVDNFGFFPFPESFGKIERDHLYEDESFSQEFRLSGETESVFWQVGTYYYDASNEQGQSTGTWGLPFTRGGGNNIADEEGNNDGETRFQDFADSETESLAFFGQATWSVNDWLSVTAGVRHTEVDKDFYALIDGEPHRRWFQEQDVDCTDVADPGPRFCEIERNESESWSNTSPLLTLSGAWEDVGPFNSLLTYATYSEGWKEGGFQSPSSTIQDVEEFRIDPESAENMEIGFKSRFWENRATFNVTAFHTDYIGQQTSQIVNDLLLTFNLDSEIDGIEIDGSLAVAEWLTLHYSAAFYDSAYSRGASIGPNPEDDVSGNNTVGTPDTSYALSWDAGTVFDNGLELFFLGGYSFTDAVESDPDNAIAAADAVGRNLLRFTESEILNATLGIRKDNWELALWGRNLLDDFVATNVASFADFWLLNAWAADNPNVAVFEGTRTEPLTYGVSFRWTFN